MGEEDLELGREKKLSADFAPSMIFAFLLPLYLANSSLLRRLDLSSAP